MDAAVQPAVALLLALAAPQSGTTWTTVRANDGTAERITPGERVRFEGYLVANFEIGVWVGTRRLDLPSGGTARDRGDYICADLEIPIRQFGRMQRLTGSRVVVTGIAGTRRSEPDSCLLDLHDVQVRRR